MPWVGLVLLEGVRLALEVPTWQDWGQETRGDVTRDLGLQRPPPGNHPLEAPPPNNSGVCDVSTAGCRGGKSRSPGDKQGTGCGVGGCLTPARGPVLQSALTSSPQVVSTQLGEPLEGWDLHLRKRDPLPGP